MDSFTGRRIIRCPALRRVLPEIDGGTLEVAGGACGATVSIPCGKITVVARHALYACPLHCAMFFRRCSRSRPTFDGRPVPSCASIRLAAIFRATHRFKSDANSAPFDGSCRCTSTYKHACPHLRAPTLTRPCVRPEIRSQRHHAPSPAPFPPYPRPRPRFLLTPGARRRNLHRP